MEMIRIVRKLFNISSVRGKTMLTILPIIVFTLLVMSLISYKYSESLLIHEIQNKMTAKLQGTIKDIEKQLTDNGTLVKGIASAVDYTDSNNLSQEQYNSLLKKTVASSNVTFGAGVFYETYAYSKDIKYYGPYAYKDNGRVINTDEYSNEKFDYLDQNWYKIGKNSKEKLVWTDPYYDEVTQVAMLTAVVPLQDNQGDFRGVVSGNFDFGTLQKLISELHLNIKADVYLLNKEGQYLANPEKNKVMQGKITEDNNKSLSDAAKTMFSGKEGAFTYFRKEARRVYYAPVPGFGWTLAIDVSEADLLAPLNDLLYRMFTIFVIAIFVASTALFFYSRYIVLNIKMVNKFAMAIVQGDLSQSMEVRSKDEFGQMTENLNTMRENFESQYEEITAAYEEIEISRRELTHSEEKYRVLVENSKDLIYRLDTKGKLVSVNKAFKKSTGLTKDEIIGNDMSIFIKDSNKLNEFNESLGQVVKTGKYKYANFEYIKITGEKIVYDVSLIPIRNNNDEIIGITGTNHDISKILKNEEKIRQLAYYDTLTGLPNRVLFSERVASAINKANSDAKLLVVMYLDLDNFKRINDTKGHHIGDMVLKKVAERLINIISEPNIVTRMGGDEFTILLENITSLKEVNDIAVRILYDIEQPCLVNGFKYDLSTCIGISLYPEDGQSVEELLKNSDIAMYKAKSAGKNSFQFFNSKMMDEILDRVEIELNLRNALSNNEMYIEFQPQIDALNGTIRGAEALMRWKNPKYGVISPVRFIPILEENTKIVKFGDWILRQSCFLNKEIQRKGLNAITIAVNISSLQLRQKNFVNRVREILNETGLEPKYLELEITESVLINGFEEVLEKLVQLKELGIKISLDDFGTGFSSLNYLRQLPINTLKIDKSFLSEISEVSKDRVIIGSIISLAHKLDMEVVAEGVETQEQNDYLINNHCDYLQGFYHSKPVSMKDLEKLIARG